MPRTIHPPHLRELETMAGQGNAVTQLRAGLTQIPGQLPVYNEPVSKKEEEEGKLQPRPKAPAVGQLIVNRHTETGKPALEIWFGGAWVEVKAL